MAEELTIPLNITKEEKYEALLPQLRALLEGEKNLIANLANISSALKHTFHWLWVGFYLVDDKQLVLGPFQGPIACTRINLGKGVCGQAWEKGEALLVPNVDEFPGHIACSSDSKSEIVLPILQNNKVIAVLDVDSEQLNHFDQTDLKYLQEIAALAGNCFLSV